MYTCGGFRKENVLVRCSGVGSGRCWTKGRVRTFKIKLCVGRREVKDSGSGSGRPRVRKYGWLGDGGVK